MSEARTHHFNGKLLQRMRTERGYSLVDVALRTELSMAALSQFEMGKYAPQPDVLYRIARFFKVEPGVFLEPDEPGTPSRQHFDLWCAIRALPFDPVEASSQFFQLMREYDQKKAGAGED